MEEKEINTEQEKSSKLLSIIDLVKLVRRHLLFIAVTCLVVVGIGSVYIFSLPRSYTSRVVLAPELSSKTGGLGGNLSSLTALAGIKLGGGTDDAINMEHYPKVIVTPTFLADLLKVKVRPQGKRNKVTLQEYLTRGQKAPWWSNLFPSSDEEKPLGTINPYRMTKKQEQLIRELKGAIFSKVEKTTVTITIEVTMQDPEVATQLCDTIRTRLQKYITRYRTNKARNDLAYMEKITKEAKEDYLDAQTRYAQFSDTHRDLILSSYRQEEERLENEVQLAYNVYSQSAQQMQLARAKVQESTPAFTILEPAVVPVKPSAPKRIITVAVLCFLSFFGSVTWLLLKQSYRKHKGNNPQATDEAGE